LRVKAALVAFGDVRAAAAMSKHVRAVAKVRLPTWVPED
jgi:hypothetical protein